VPDVPDYTECTNNNDCATVKATHAIDKKMRVDIVTMNTALANVFLKALSLQVHASFLQRCLRKRIIVFVNIFVLFVNHYGKTTAEDHEVNRQCMAADWHPADGFDTLVLCLFTGVAFAGCTNFTMADRNIVNIGLHVIKWCGMYAEEYKAWIAHEAIRPRIVETFDSFKTFWAAKIILVNQTTIPTSQYGYGMATTNNDNYAASYGESIANFGGVSEVAGHKDHGNAPLVWIRLTQWERRWRRQWWRRWLPIAGISNAKSNGPTSGLHPQAVQVLQKLELLPHSWWQHQQWAHQQD
jgi:hypothetical protein